MKKKRTFSYFSLIKYILIALTALLVLKFIIDNIVTILWVLFLVALIGGSLAIMIYGARKELKELKKQKTSPDEEPSESNDTKQEAPKTTYRAKQRLITKNEESYLKAIENCIDHNLYDIHSQIPLSSIVEKIDHSRYHNELFRSIDFLITDKEQKPLLCIEINDKTHNRFDRQERDHKVQSILHEAEIPLVTFWTKYGVNEEYISKRINEILQSHS